MIGLILLAAGLAVLVPNTHYSLAEHEEIERGQVCCASTAATAIP